MSPLPRRIRNMWGCSLLIDSNDWRRHCQHLMTTTRNTMHPITKRTVPRQEKRPWIMQRTSTWVKALSIIPRVRKLTRFFLSAQRFIFFHFFSVSWTFHTFHFYVLQGKIDLDSTEDNTDEHPMQDNTISRTGVTSTQP